MSSHNYHPVQTNPFPIKIKLLSLAWKMVNATFYRFSPFFFRGWRRFLVRLFGGAISSTASLNRLAKIDFPWNLRMDDLASINPNSWIYALDKISIGEKSCIGEGVKLLTGTHSLTEPTFDLKTFPISIGPCCWISTSATILPCVTIGEGAVVGACAVVTKDVEPWTVVAGNPARFVKRRELKISQPR